MYEIKMHEFTSSGTLHSDSEHYIRSFGQLLDYIQHLDEYYVQAYRSI
jgi:hypothetical protein